MTARGEKPGNDRSGALDLSLPAYCLVVCVIGLGLLGLAGLLSSLAGPPVPTRPARTTLEQRVSGQHLDPDKIRQELISLDAVRRALAEIGFPRSEQTNALALRILPQLDVESDTSGESQQLTLTLAPTSGIDAEQSAALVNRLLHDYLVGDQRRRLAAAVAADRLAAGTATEAGRRLADAQRQFAQSLERLLASVQTPVPGALELPGPSRTSGTERKALRDLQQRLNEMLEVRTPAHPEVHDLEVKIHALEAKLADLPAETAPPLAAPRIDNNLVERVEADRRRFEEASANHERASEAAREARERLVQCRDADWQFLVEAQPAEQIRGAIDARKVIAGAAVAAIGVAASAWWLRRDASRLRNRSDAERALGVPVVGVLARSR